MPFAKREDKIAYMKDWRKQKMSGGYGKWLYQRRKLRFDDAERFREALEEILSTEGGEVSDEELRLELIEVRRIARKALDESKAAEEELGEYKE